MPPAFPPPLPCRRRGYSLTEVTLAIALVSFSLLIIFSLMTVGLNTINATSEQTAETEIANTLGIELHATPYTALTTHIASRFPVYFTHDGEEVAGADAASRASYQAACELPDLATAPDGTEWQRAILSISRIGAAAPLYRRAFLLVDKGS